MSDKKISPKEAGLAVLAKVAELAKKHEQVLAKGEDPLNSVAGDRAKRAEDYKKQGDTKSLQIAQDGMKDAHKERLEGIKNAPKPNLTKDEENANSVAGAQGESMPAENPMQMSEDAPKPMKGSYRLAKFVGRMDQKRGKPAGELDKSINQPDKSYSKAGMPGVSEMGAKVRSANVAASGVEFRNAKHASGNAMAYGDNTGGRKDQLQATSKIQDAKKIAGHVADEMKAAPKPKLPG